MIEVVSALIWDNSDRLFLTQRSDDATYPLHWCDPGGKVETTDTTRAHALSREVREEVGLDISHSDLVLVRRTIFHSPFVALPLALSQYSCGADIAISGCGPIAGNKVIGFGWFTMLDALSLPLTPGLLAYCASRVGSRWNAARAGDQSQKNYNLWCSLTQHITKVRLNEKKVKGKKDEST